MFRTSRVDRVVDGMGSVIDPADMGAWIHSQTGAVVTPVRERSSGVVLEELPYVLRGYASDWNACSRWSVSALRASFPNVKVTVWAFDSGSSSGLPDAVGTTLLSSFIDWLERTSGSGDPLKRRYYAGRVPIDLMPDLREDVIEPEGLGYPLETNLWIGNAGTQSGLHFDPVPGLLVHVAGEKVAVIWPPSDSRLLRPEPLPSSANSALNVFDALSKEDRQALEHSTPYLARLHRGDAVFIPSHWWHAFLTATDLSISVNFWPLQR